MEAKELKAKTSQELLKKIDDLKAELFTLRFRNSTGELDQPHKIKVIKRHIARLFTQLVHLQNQSKTLETKSQTQTSHSQNPAQENDSSPKPTKKSHNLNSKEEAS